MQRVLKTFTHTDGKRRVLIVQKSKGIFGYVVEKLTYLDEETEDRAKAFWHPLGQKPLALCDTAETAEREARGRVDWLNECLDPE